MPKIKPIKPRRAVLRSRRHMRRRSGRMYPWDMSMFIDSVEKLPEGVNVGDLLRIFADNDEFWELTRLAGRLQKERTEVLEKLERLRNKLMAQFTKRFSRRKEK